MLSSNEVLDRIIERRGPFTSNDWGWKLLMSVIFRVKSLQVVKKNACFIVFLYTQSLFLLKICLMSFE